MRTSTPLKRIPISICVLGLVSMLMDISSEMIHSLLPLFLVDTLGASALMVGLIEGLAESTALIVKVFSGALSDYLGKRKALAVFGYLLGSLTKPLFAIAPTAGIVLAARLLDRVGKGVRGAPRDALVADIAPVEVRGAAFGLRQSLDTVGALLGPLLAVGLMLLWANDFRSVFWVAVVPGLLAVCLLLFGVREPKRHICEKRTNPIRGENLKRLSGAYWWVVGIGSVFTLARFSEAFLVCRISLSIWEVVGSNGQRHVAGTRLGCPDRSRPGFGGKRPLAHRRRRCVFVGRSHGDYPGAACEDGRRHSPG
jgi:Na+/melibiose symporter-like transporter